MRVLPAGPAAVLLELDGLDQVLALHAALRTAVPDGVVDLVPAARTVLVLFDPAVTTAERVVAGLPDPPGGVGPDPAGEVVTLPVHYDGPDLPEVARLTGLSEGEVVDRHRRAQYVVAFFGFAPGFAYLAGGDPALRVPRRDGPRTAVPPGSVAVADEFTGVYPRRMPGGWRLVGRTDAVLWDLDRDPPALLRPGTRVRFEDAR